MRIDRKGRLFHAIVTRKAQRQLEVAPIEHAISYRTAKAREVLELWRKSRARTPRSEPAAAAER
ncbi:MAG: hypothetical protein ACRDKL_11120 [Solirubrobacteraceae bacterium]